MPDDWRYPSRIGDEWHDRSGGRFWRLARPQLIELVAQFELRPLEQVSIDAKGHRRVAVAHPLGQRQDIRTEVDKQGSM
jgi:hypothetical protein